MEKTSLKQEKIKVFFQDGTIFESISWLQCQAYVKSYASPVLNFSMSYLGREFCNWPPKKNYYFSKKTICFPGGSVVNYRYIGYVQNRLLIKTLYKMPEFQEISSETLLLNEKDKDFLLCQK